MKLAKNTYPDGHGPTDFACFGPPAIRDGEFDGTMIADLGFFAQGDTDSNKFYHGAVVQSKKTQAWFAYFEWGRTGATNNSYQFNTAISKEDAHAIFADQMHAKNDKRGMWTTVAGIKTLTCKPKKDCYLVRALATRVTGLPDARTIVSSDGAKAVTKPTAASSVSTAKKVDPITIKLLRDLGAGTVAFTRSSMADASIPTQTSIDEGRQILDEAVNRIGIVGSNIQAQVNDKDLMDMTALLYKRIPKKKERNASQASWILSSENIFKWREDLDAFEGALYARPNNDVVDADPYDGMNIDMEYIDPKSPIGEFLHRWWPNATRNAHANMGEMEIVHSWVVHQHDGITPFDRALRSIHADNVKYRPLHQPAERIDLDPAERPLFEKAHVSLLFHASRSCNVSSILRKRLVLPKNLKGVVINGALFGSGALYHADDIKKSAQYASLPGAVWSKGSGSIAGRHAFMLVNDVVLGNPHLAPGKFGYTEAPKGHHSVFGKGRNTPGPGSPTAALENNEWMVYDQDQHRIRYLIEFRERSGTRGHARRFG